jgi:signal transduction histidine kinase/DNA-binding response OmpR family regulator
MATSTYPGNEPIRILVVDDHPNTAATLARAISQLGPGVDVLSAESGEKALELVKDRTVDLLFTDMVMPGMNGLELIEKLQSHPGGRLVYAALITAYDVPGLKETARRLKVNDIIMKPVRPERICQIVAGTIENLGHAPMAPLPVTKPQLKILIADDRPDNIALLSRYLENEGYKCITACNGAEALIKMRTGIPDLVLLDVNMPVKDGFETLQEIRTDPAIGHIPVIILTAARLEPADMQHALNMGADDYITKPFDRRELLARIRTRLRVKEAEDIIRRQNKELNLLPEIGRDLSARPDVNELMDVVLHRTVETLGALLGHIILLAPKGPLTRTYCFSASSTPVGETLLLPLKDLLKQARETRQGFIIKDTHKDARWQTSEDDPIRSVVVVPMLGRFDLLGLLVLAHEQADYFNLEHKLLLQAIASQAAIAIENAQLHEGGALDQQRRAAMFESTADAVLLLDETGRLLMLSPVAEKLFSGLALQPGMPLTRGQGYDAMMDLLDQARTAQITISNEIVWSDQRVFTACVTPIKDVGYGFHLHDVSQFKTLDKVRNEFIALTTHDLKNRLTLIALTSQLIQKAGPLNEKQVELINQIINTTRNMDSLLQRLLEPSILEQDVLLHKMEQVDLNALVAEVTGDFQVQAEMRQQTIQLEQARISPWVLGNPFQLRHALGNLVDNAIKYSPMGGAICLSVETGEKEAVLRVKDNGFGIPQADLPFIFDRFHRVHSQETEKIAGSGLGLSIVKPVIEQHQGHLEVESEVGKGSCFTISLPITRIPDPAFPDGIQQQIQASLSGPA